VSDVYQQSIETSLAAADILENIIRDEQYADLVAAFQLQNALTELRDSANALDHHMTTNVAGRGSPLELHHHKDRKYTPYDLAYIRAAQCHNTCEQQVDDESVVSGSDDEGDYVLGWIWVPEDEVTVPTYKAKVYYRDDNGEKQLLGEHSVETFDKDEARQQIMDALWDSRLDAASCTPVIEWQST